jgi:hypothetical protein
LFNLLVTNIPGPQFPLYVLGRQLEDLFPVAFLPSRQALAVAIMSYNGGIDFGLLADYDALPDLDVIVAGLSESLDELLDAAHGKSAAMGTRESREVKRDRSPASIVPAGSSRPKRGPAADMRAKRTRRSEGANGGVPNGQSK